MVFSKGQTIGVLLILVAASIPTVTSLDVESGVDERVVEPYRSYEEGFRWQYGDWYRDVDGDKVDDLIEAVDAAGIEALPHMSDGFLPYSARAGTSGPVLDLHIAYEAGVSEQDLHALKALGISDIRTDTMLPSAWAIDATPAQAYAIATLPGVVMVELEQVVRSLNNIARQATQVEESATYTDGVRDDLGYTGSGVGVAILDTGVDDDHGFLENRFVAGADTLVGGCTVNADINPDDDNHVSVGIIGFGLSTYHGTHVAGTALGHGSLTSSPPGNFAGMAKDADLYDVKVLTSTGISCGNSVRNGLSWVDAFNQGATMWHNPTHPDHVAGSPQIKVVSMSLGGDCAKGTDGLSMSVDWLVQMGVSVVVAVGNDGVQHNSPREGCITSPSAAPGAISVGAYDDNRSVTRNDDVVASFSNCGPTHYDTTVNPSLPNSDQKKPDVTAPGVSIISAHGDREIQGQDGSTAAKILSGTSMATPVVSGIVALMYEKNVTLTPSEVKSALRSNAEYKTSGNGFTIGSDYHSCWGFGQVNAYTTVDSLTPFP